MAASLKALDFGDHDMLQKASQSSTGGQLITEDAGLEPGKHKLDMLWAARRMAHHKRPLRDC